MSFAAMSAQVVTPEAYNKLQQDHEQLRAKTAQLVGQFKALKAEKEAAAAFSPGQSLHVLYVNARKRVLHAFAYNRFFFRKDPYAFAC